MSKIRQKYSRDFKLTLLRELEGGKGVAELSRKYEIHPSLITRWRTVYRENPEEAFKGNGNTYRHEAKIAELERIVGQLYAENAFLKKTMTSLEKRLQEGKKRDGQR